MGERWIHTGTKVTTQFGRLVGDDLVEVRDAQVVVTTLQPDTFAEALRLVQVEWEQLAATLGEAPSGDPVPVVPPGGGSLKEASFVAHPATIVAGPPPS